MRISTFLFLLFLSQFSFAQVGKITLKSSISNLHTFVYEPKQGLKIPSDAVVYSVFIDKDTKKKEIPLIKSGNRYEFSAPASDSVNIAFFTINAPTKEIIDDNDGKSYVVYLKNKTPKEQDDAIISEMLNTHYAFYLLKLNEAKSDILEKYEMRLRENPKLKEAHSYITYLRLKYEQTSDEQIKNEMLAIAHKYTNSTKEEEFLEAYYTFWNFRLDKEIAEVEEISSQNFPHGFIASRNFLNKYFKIENRTDSLAFEKWTEFCQKFPNFKSQGESIIESLIYSNLEKRNLSKIEELEKHISIKTNLASTYNNYAWNLATNDSLNNTENIVFAEKISKKSVDLISSFIAEKGNNVEERYTENKENYLDTYAYILGVQKRYKEAYTIESQLTPSKDDFWRVERTAVYAENYKGQLFAKEFLEKTLTTNGGSEAMLKQLKNIYQQQKLPMSDLKPILAKAESLNLKKTEKQIIDRFGSLKAPMFSLKNIKNQEISLAEQKGKIVVIDFWATWCGPCIASMPQMQVLANKYKNASFLFIDTLESPDLDINKKKVVELMKKSNYSFNVLFDTDSQVSKNYSVEMIPNKIVVGKDGNILAINPSNESLEAILEANK